MNKIADIPIGNLGTGSNFNLSHPFSTFNSIISTIISIMTVIAGIWFIFILMTGAISWITAGGDKASLETARKRIINGLIGIVIVVAAIFLADILGKLLGFSILNPGDVLNKL